MVEATPAGRSAEAGGQGPAEAAEWLSYFQSEELKRVIERWKLPRSETREAGIETLAGALAEGRAPVREPGALEAVRRFEKLNLPEQRAFLSRCGLKSGGIQIDVLRRIEDHLGTGGIVLETAFDYLDELYENGAQHLFPFRLKRGRRAGLAPFQEAGALLEKLRGLRPVPEPPPGDREVIRQGLYEPAPREALFFETEIEAPEPLLVAVYWRHEQRHRVLYFKWVETREWRTLEGKAAEPKVVELRERSVNFLRLDLATGDLEVRLQRLHGNPRRSLQEELDRFRREIGRLLAWDDYVPVLIEPAIRRLLVSTRATVMDWKVSWTDSGKLGGGVDPEMVRSIFRRFTSFSAVHLTATWQFEERGKEPRSVKARLEAKTNEVELYHRCGAYELQLVLADVRRGSTARLRIPELEETARAEEDLRQVLLQIEIALGGRQGDSGIDLRRLARESWLAEDRAFEVAARLAERYPERFELRLSARCPESGKPARTLDGAVTFLSLEAIPDTFRCLHEQPRRYEDHPSRGNVEAELIFRPRSRPPPLERIQRHLERRLGGGSARLYTNVLALLLFTVLYALVVLATAAGFLGLSELFGGGTGVSLALAVPFGLVLLLEAGVVVKLLGGPVTRTAVGVLEKLTALFDPRRDRGGAAAWPADVHEVPPGASPGPPGGGRPANGDDG